MAVRRFCAYCGDRLVLRTNGPRGPHPEYYHVTPGMADQSMRPDTTTVNQAKRGMRRSVVAGVRDLMD